MCNPLSLHTLGSLLLLSLLFYRKTSVKPSVLLLYVKHCNHSVVLFTVFYDTQPFPYTLVFLTFPFCLKVPSTGVRLTRRVFIVFSTRRPSGSVLRYFGVRKEGYFFIFWGNYWTSTFVLTDGLPKTLVIYSIPEISSIFT